MSIWHVITGEYPPQPGGVSDYTRLVCDGLASAHNTVHVWAPADGLRSSIDGSIKVHRLPGRFGTRALRMLADAIHATPGCSILVQYVPHAYGFRAMNVQFCLWLRAIRRSGLKVMFHEVAFPVSATQSCRQNALGAVTSIMARLVCRSASLIMVASERWAGMLRDYGAIAPILWLPVPSNIPVVIDAAAREQWRHKYAVSNHVLIGHFANYSDYSLTRLAQLLSALFQEQTGLSFLLLGAKSIELRQRLLSWNPHFANRLHASGAVAATDISAGLAACDLMVQPYPDGVSTRRSSMSALLAHGRAIVTTAGIGTEQLWRDSGAVVAVPVDAPDRLRAELSRMIVSDEIRSRQGRAAKALYEDRFALRHTIAALTST